MQGGPNNKSVRVEFVISEPEAELVKERMTDFLLCPPFIVPTLFYEMSPPASKPPSLLF